LLLSNNLYQVTPDFVTQLRISYQRATQDYNDTTLATQKVLNSLVAFWLSQYDIKW